MSAARHSRICRVQASALVPKYFCRILRTLSGAVHHPFRERSSSPGRGLLSRIHLSFAFYQSPIQSLLLPVLFSPVGLGS